MDINNSEGLMVWVIHRIADCFGNHAILKGGMELRLVDCPRHTNDLDYIFIPFSSKTAIKDRILSALGENEKIKVSCSVNSKCIRYVLTYESIKTQMEVNVAASCESQELSTSSLARANNQQAHIVRVMKFSVALAHKLAAWNERELIRDLYDTYYYSIILNVEPDHEVLQLRLKTVENRVRKSKPFSMTLIQFIDKLHVTAAGLTQQMVSHELRDYLQSEELPGLDRKIAAGIQRIIDCLRKHT